MTTKRERVLAKTKGHCGYCGVALLGRWHMDHVEAIFRGRDDIGGEDNEANLMAACSRCNLWKKTFTVEQFRDEITAQSGRLYRDSAAYRLAYDFGVVAPHKNDIRFYFESMS